MLRKASEEMPQQRFVCRVLSPEANLFVEHWAPKIHAFVLNCFGPYGKEPLPEILKIEDGFHIAGATASFDPGTGRIRLATSVSTNPGQILEKLTHEMTHAALANFPDDDGFHTEGYVDYSVWIMAHAPVWGEQQAAMIQAASDNIRNRRERALRGGSDWDKKRWAGGFYASVAYGPYTVARLRQKKVEGDLTW
jgi:hypothetical protein